MTEQSQLPTVFMSEQVLTQIVSETRAHPHTETGATFIGVETDNMMIILGVIPDLHDTVRETGLFSAGGNDQVKIYDWLDCHWNDMRKRSRGPAQPAWLPSRTLDKGIVPKELDLPLTVLGDWHKHPGDYRVLSGTDIGQIRMILEDAEQQREQILSPIVTYDEREQLDYQVIEHEIIGRIGQGFRMSWYYSSRKAGINIKIKPVILPDFRLPELPPLPWHIRDERRMTMELALLRDAGHSVRWLVKQMDDDPIHEIIFGIDNPAWSQQLLIVTDWNYPNVQPTARIFPKPKTAPQQEAQPGDSPATQPSAWDVLTQWLRNLVSGRQYLQATPVLRPLWTNTIYLLDVVKRLEKEGSLSEPLPTVAQLVGDSAERPVEPRGEDDRNDSD